MAFVVACALAAQPNPTAFESMSTASPAIEKTLTSTLLSPKSATPKPSSTSTPLPTKRATPTQYSMLIPSYQLVSTSCNTEGCLFRDKTDPNKRDLLRGIATIKGYYVRVEDASWGETKICDAFVAIGGSQELIQSFIALVDAGNTINSKNELNQPIVKLDFHRVSAADKRRISASTQATPIEMIVLWPEQGAYGAPACFSFVEILKVK